MPSNESYIPDHVIYSTKFTTKVVKFAIYLTLLISAIYLILSNGFKKKFDPTNGFLITPKTNNIVYVEANVCRGEDFIVIEAPNLKTCENICTNFEQFNCLAIQETQTGCKLFKTLEKDGFVSFFCFEKIESDETNVPTKSPTSSPKFKQIGFQCETNNVPNFVFNLNTLKDCENKCLENIDCESINFQTRDFPFVCSIFFNDVVKNAEQNYIDSVCLTKS